VEEATHSTKVILSMEMAVTVGQLRLVVLQMVGKVVSITAVSQLTAMVVTVG
jgi:hypothetical protein